MIKPRCNDNRENPYFVASLSDILRNWGFEMYSHVRLKFKLESLIDHSERGESPFIRIFSR